ncbi:hypothetical protein [Bacillus sp. 1P06AnD]|uniref:hypothetical protein n=1 Tax=Bacillus sp. 1P06AnD TaxID=3132208 RepID=UPI00399FDA40
MKLIIYQNDSRKAIDDLYNDGVHITSQNIGSISIEPADQLYFISDDLYRSHKALFTEAKLKAISVQNYLVQSLPYQENLSVFYELGVIRESSQFFTLLTREKLQSKGVFRMKRRVKRLNKEKIVEDVSFLCRSFGAVEYAAEKSVEHPGSGKKYGIATVRFSEGVLAQIEYEKTFSDDESLELEWSGQQKIISYSTESQTNHEDNNDGRLSFSLTALGSAGYPLTAGLHEEIKKIKELLYD